MEHAPVSYNTPVANEGNHEQRTASSGPPPNTYSTSAASNSNTPTPASLQDNLANPLPAGIAPQPNTFTHLDLELIHFWSTQTYMTMTSKLTAHLVWRDVIFREGLKHDFLLHALMATAALHKATNHAEDSDTHAKYIKVAFSYQNAALAGYIPALSRPSEENAVALFVLSALLSIWLFGSKKLPEALNGVKFTSSPNFLPQMVKPASENEPTDFLEILTLLQGINAVVKQTIQWLQSGGIGPLFQPPLEGELPPNPPDIEASFQMMQDRIERNNSLQIDSAKHMNREGDQTNLKRLNELRYIARARTVLEHDQQVFAWPVTSELPYIELIRQRDPMAIALFIHWAACFKCLDHLWWAKGWSYRLVKDASLLLDDSWADILAWPRKEVGLD